VVECAGFPPEADQPWADENMYYVYILQNKKKELYKGSTQDLKQRLIDHNNGRVTSTKNKRPWQLIYYEAFLSKKLARKEELFLKTGKGRERIKYVLDQEKEECKSGLFGRSRKPSGS
jgi:putative endonuclease